jgi:hypothetical protein
MADVESQVSGDRCTVPNCGCQISPEASVYHGQLLAHLPNCPRCRDSHGRHEMCPTGATLYGTMLAWMLKAPVNA